MKGREFVDKFALWVYGLTLLLVVAAIPYPATVLSFRQTMPLIGAQFFATILVGYPVYLVCLFIHDFVYRSTLFEDKRK